MRDAGRAMLDALGFQSEGHPRAEERFQPRRSYKVRDKSLPYYMEVG